MTTTGRPASTDTTTESLMATARAKIRDQMNAELQFSTTQATPTTPAPGQFSVTTTTTPGTTRVNGLNRMIQARDRLRALMGKQPLGPRTTTTTAPTTTTPSAAMNEARLKVLQKLRLKTTTTEASTVEGLFAPTEPTTESVMATARAKLIEKLRMAAEEEAFSDPDGTLPPQADNQMISVKVRGNTGGLDPNGGAPPTADSPNVVIDMSQTTTQRPSITLEPLGDNGLNALFVPTTVAPVVTVAPTRQQVGS